jgi:hypothetical protein
VEPGGSLPHLQEPATCPYPEPAQSSPCPPSHFLTIHFNIILPSTRNRRNQTLDFDNGLWRSRVSGTTLPSADKRGREGGGTGANYPGPAGPGPGAQLA